MSKVLIDIDKSEVTYLKANSPKLILSGPCSSQTTYSLHVEGPFTLREMRNIIAILTLHKNWLEEDEQVEAGVIPPHEVRDEQQ